MDRPVPAGHFEFQIGALASGNHGSVLFSIVLDEHAGGGIDEIVSTQQLPMTRQMART